MTNEIEKQMIGEPSDTQETTNPQTQSEPGQALEAQTGNTPTNPPKPKEPTKKASAGSGASTKGNKITERDAGGKIPKLDVTQEDIFEVFAGMGADATLDMLHKECTALDIKVARNTLGVWCTRYKWMEKRRRRFMGMDHEWIPTYVMQIKDLGPEDSVKATHGARVALAAAVSRALKEQTLKDVMPAVKDAMAVLDHMPGGTQVPQMGDNVAVLQDFRTQDEEKVGLPNFRKNVQAGGKVN